MYLYSLVIMGIPHMIIDNFNNQKTVIARIPTCVHANLCHTKVTEAGLRLQRATRKHY